MPQSLKNTRNSTIQNHLVWYYIVFAVLTVVLVTSLTYTQAVQSLHQAVDDKLDTIALLKIDNLNQWVDEQQSSAVFLASLPELRAGMGILLAPETSEADRTAIRDELIQLVTLIAQRTAEYRDIQILDLNGSVAVSVSPRYIGVSQADQLFFQEGLEKTFVQNFYKSDLFGHTTLTIATPLFDMGNKRVGVLVLHFNMKRVDDTFHEDQKLNDNIQSYLINSDHELITNDPIALSETPTPSSFAIDTALKGGEGKASYVNHNGVAVIGKYQWIKERNVALIVEINEENALWPARHLAANVALTGLLFSIALVIIVTVMAQRITAPLRALTQTVTRISEGDLTASAPVLSDDEVGTLARAFNTMTEKLRQSMAGLESELHERKQVESAMRDSEEKFRTVFETSPTAISITTLEDGRLLDANYAFWDLTGLTSEKAIGKYAEELKLWDTHEKREQFVKDLKRKGSLYNSDDTMRDQSGNIKHTISFFRLVKLGGEERVISMFYDMSAQKQTLQALQQSESRVRALLAAIPDMILELSLNGLITNMVPPKGMEEAMRPEDFMGRQVYEVFSETVASQTLFAIERVVETDQMNVFEFEETMSGTTVVMEARLVANTATTAIMMVRDITHRKQIERERESLIQELEDRNRESETMRESLAAVVGTFEFSQIINQILDQIKRVIPYDSASVWRVDDKLQMLMGERYLPPELVSAGLSFPIDAKNHALPLITGELPYMISHDVQADFPRFRQEPHNYINSWLGVPLKARGKIIGLIALDGKEKHQFNEHHVELVVTFSDQVAIALENADLFSNLQTELEERKALIQELEIKNVESETLRESTTIVAATLDVSETAKRILEQIKRVVRYDSASIWLYEGEKVTMVGWNGLPPEMQTLGEYVRSSDTPDYKFWNYKEETPFILIDDLQEDYPIYRNPPWNYIRSWLGVPLRARGILIGFVAMDSSVPGKFTKHDAEAARTFAEQVSIAVENARLFSDLQAELDERSNLIYELEIKNIESETLRDSTAIVASTLEISETVQRILEQIKRVVSYDSTSAWLYHGEKMVRMGSIGLPYEMDTLKEYIRDDDSPDYGFWSTDEEIPYILFDDLQEHYPIFRDPPLNYIHGWLGVSLRARGKLIGFIALDSRTSGRFTEHDAELARTFAEQVSVALENARLFSDLQAELASRQSLITELESKNAELERFTYTVSHDLKSPLFTIRGFLGYLEQDALSGNHTRLKSDMQRIKDATDKMQNLLNDLLELSRVGRVGNEPEVISFDELVHEAIEIVHGRITDRGIALHVQTGLPKVYGDRVRLFEVVQNLVDNASKFMGDQREPRIEIGQNGEIGGKPVFYVRDNGIGIAPEHHERVFGLFNKLDVKADGTGIGLALVRRIIEVHGGEIWVESELGRGAAFCFTLPVPPDPEINGE